MVNGMNRPFPNTYWVDPGRLLAGEYPGARDRERTISRIESFLDAGVQHFVDLTEKGELETYADILVDRACSRGMSVSHARHPIPDHSVPADSAVLSRILRDINAALAGGRLVYVHCCNGGGRTGLVMGCWLAQQYGDGWRALSNLHRLWSSMDKARFQHRTPETVDQIRTVLSWPDAAVIESGVAPFIGKRAQF